MAPRDDEHSEAGKGAAMRVAGALEDARRLEKTGRIVEARAELEGALVAVLERPWALEIWLRILDRLEPAARQRAVELVEVWCRRATELLEQPTHPGGGRGAPELLSRTLARVYREQGHVDKALEIYGRLVERDPDDLELLEEFLALSTQGRDGGAGQAARRSILARWAREIRRRKDRLKALETRENGEER